MSDERDDKSEKTPPVFTNWRRWYLVVLGALVVQVILYYWLTSLFS